MIRNAVAVVFLLLSLNVVAGNLEKFNIQVKNQGVDLVITASGEEQPPSLMDAVDRVLTRIIGTHLYREDVYNPKHQFGPTPGRIVFEGGEAKLIGGDGFKSSSTYPRFFNAPLINKAGLSIQDWISEIERELDLMLRIPY